MLHTTSHGTTSFASIYMGIQSQNYVYNSAQVIYHIDYSLKTFLKFLVNTDSEVLYKTDAWIFAPILPILVILAVCMMDIRTRHPKKTRKRMDGPSDIKKHGRIQTAFRNSVAISTVLCAWALDVGIF